MSKRLCKHTPGPWHRHDLDIHASYGEGDAAQHYIVAEAVDHGGMTPGESEANAALITAAPSMYEACATMRDQHEMLRGKCPCIVCEAAREAER
jgi:hypothetical protein